MPVKKSDGRIRICGDYKITVNRAAKLEKYPIPRIEELFVSLAGGKAFTKLDLSHAYLQIWGGLCSLYFPTRHGEPSSADQLSVRLH